MKFNKITGEIKDSEDVERYDGNWLNIVLNWYPIYHPLNHKYMGYMSDFGFEVM